MDLIQTSSAISYVSIFQINLLTLDKRLASGTFEDSFSGLFLVRMSFLCSYFNWHKRTTIRRSVLYLVCFWIVGSGMPEFMQGQPAGTTTSIDQAFSGLVSPRLSSESSDYLVENWNVRDGLPRSGVTAIAQTPDGFLWLGLKRGLARFDGFQFKHYHPSAHPGLVKRPVTTLFVDHSGKLWIGSAGDGVSVMEHDRFRKLAAPDSLDGDDVRQFAEDKDGRIWRASLHGIHYYEGEVARSVTKGELAGATSYRVVWDSYSERILGCYWETAGSWQDGSFERLVENGTNRPIPSNNFFMRRDGGVWVLSSEPSQYASLHRLLPNGKLTPPQTWPFPIPQYGISAFLEDTEGRLWISVSKDALYCVGGDGVYERFELGQESVTSIFEDSEGTIWAGSVTSGLYRLKRRLFRTYPEIGLASAHMLFTDHQGGIIFTQGQKVFNIQQDGNLRPLGVESHYGALLDKHHHLWSGNVGSLTQWKWSGTQFDKTAMDNRPMFYGCQSMFLSNGQTLWFSGNAGGIARQSGETISIIDLETGVVTAFADAAEGEVWLGYDTGQILKTDQDVLMKIPGLSDQIHHAISSIYTASDQSLWIATLGGGLFHWSNGDLTSFTTDSGLPSNEIGGIAGMDDMLWLATTRGVAVIYLNQLKAVKEQESATVHCRVFGPEHGLPNLECSTSFFPAIHLSNQGKLWIATLEGITSIDTKMLPRKASNPATHIVEIRVNERTVPFDSGTVIVPAGTVRLSFYYTSITLNTSRNARFQYRLVSNDRDWVDAWNAREAHYTKPPPGKYQFLVRATDHRGGWSKPAASVNVHIEPYYWQRKEFQMGSGLLAALLIALTAWGVTRGAYIERIRALIRERAIEQERSRIAQDLHDRLGSQSTQIIFRTKALKDQLLRQDWKEMESCADLIQKTAQDMTVSLDEIVWTTDPGKDNVESSMAFFLSYAESLFKDTATRLRIEVPMDVERRTLSMESRHEVFMAVREALTNALKHAQASEVWLRIRLDGGLLCISVDDDGLGLPPERVDKGRNGLRNIQRRMESIGGTVDFQPSKKGGFSVRISIPCG